jgi:hypothetical protein
MKKKIAFVFATMLSLTASFAVQPRPAGAAALVCVYLKPPEYGVQTAGYYYISPEYPGREFGSCTPRK